jgi:hypothetical protein
VRESELVEQNSLVHINNQNAIDETHVFIVSDSASVVDFGSQIVQDFVRYFVVLIEEHFELSLANSEVFHGEFVGNVPADWAELSSVLNDCVEEAKSEQKFFEFVGFSAVVQDVIVHTSVTSS